MDVVVAGGHGKVGLALLGLLTGKGHRARGLIRDPGQAVDLEAVGAEAVVCDMEAEKASTASSPARMRRGPRAPCSTSWVATPPSAKR